MFAVALWMHYRKDQKSFAVRSLNFLVKNRKEYSELRCIFLRIDLFTDILFNRLVQVLKMK